LLSDLRRECGTEVLRLEHLANLDLTPSSKGARLSHSIASALDFTSHSQNPAINSFVSANGPSITVRLLPENLTRAPLELA